MDTTKRSRIAQLLGTTANVQGHEIKAVAGSFFFVVLLMSAYYILRPVRDAMASDWSDAEVSWLWTLNFFISTAVVALYGALVARFPLRLLVPATYGIFALTFLIFYALALALNDRTLIDKSFYVWVSVFSLFHISVFWSFMSELFNKEQAGRLFGIIAAGASVGGLIGPSIPSFFSAYLSTDTLLLLASALLLLPIPLIFYLQTLKASDLGNEASAAKPIPSRIGGNPFAGFTLFISNPYLLAIGLFILLYTGISSFVYFELKNLLAELNRAERTAIWAQMDLAVNVLSIAVGLFRDRATRWEIWHAGNHCINPRDDLHRPDHRGDFAVSRRRNSATSRQARGQLRCHQTGSRGAFYPSRQRDALQSQTRYRHRRLPRRRYADGLGVYWPDPGNRPRFGSRGRSGRRYRGTVGDAGNLSGPMV
jgi:ATP/ADP translocase